MYNDVRKGTFHGNGTEAKWVVLNFKKLSLINRLKTQRGCNSNSCNSKVTGVSININSEWRKYY